MAIFLIQPKHRHTVMFPVRQIQVFSVNSNLNGTCPSISRKVFWQRGQNLFGIQNASFFIKVIAGNSTVFLIQAITETIIRMKYAMSWFRSASSFHHKGFFQITMLRVNLKYGYFANSLQTSLRRNQKPFSAPVLTHLMRM